MSWWEFRARVRGVQLANTPGSAAGGKMLTPEEHDAIVERFANV